MPSSIAPTEPDLLARIPEMSPRDRAELALRRGHCWPVWQLLISDSDAWVRRIALQQLEVELWRAHHPGAPSPVAA